MWRLLSANVPHLWFCGCMYPWLWIVSQPYFLASQGAVLTFLKALLLPDALLVLAPLVTAVFLQFTHGILAWLQLKSSDYTSLFLLPKMNLTEYAFFIVFVAFHAVLETGTVLGLDSHVYYIRSPNWSFPNYLVRITLKNIFNILIVWV